MGRKNVGEQNKIGLVLAILISGAFIAVLNETVLNVALNSIMDEFNVSYSMVQWLVTGYMLIIGTIVPISAYFMQKFTTKKLFITAMSLFTIGTVIGALSPTFSLLLIARFIQAVGTALIIPLLTNIILVVIPKEKRGVYMGTIMSIVFMFAPAIGPTLSGLIVDSFSWRAIFYFILPVSLFSLILGASILKNVTEVSNPKLDIISYLLSVVGFGGIVYGLSLAGEGEASFTDTNVIFIIAIGLLALILFVIRQLKVKDPILNVRVFKNPMFSLSLVLVMFVMIIMFSLTLMLPIYMQSALLFTSVIAGIVMLPGGLLNAVVAPITGKLFDKYGPRPLLIPGAVILVIVTFSMRYTTPGVSEWLVIGQHMILMLSVAMMLMPSQTNALNQLPKKLYPHGAAAATTLMQVSGAIGAALFIAVSENAQTNYLSQIANPDSNHIIESITVGTQQSFSIAFYFACIALILSFFIKRKA